MNDEHESVTNMREELETELLYISYMQGYEKATEAYREEIAILNKEKLHYFNKLQELAERTCSNCKDYKWKKAICSIAYHVFDNCPMMNDENFSCSQWVKKKC